jgi:multidrug resistance efflux pump
MKKKIILIAIIVIALIGGGAIAFYYNYQSEHFVNTDNAQVSADMLTITPQAAGRITKWEVKVGDKVKKNQTLGIVKTTTTLGTIENIKIKSPIKGTIIQSDAIVGQTASTSTEVAVVANTAKAYITANIKETDLSNVKVGQKVSITVDAYSGTTLTGKVNNIGQATASVFSLLPTETTSGDYTKETQLIPTKIIIDSKEGLNLMPGMNASVQITR